MMESKSTLIEDFEERKKNSMFYWYPKIKDLPIAQPKTTFMRFFKKELKLLSEEKIPSSIIERAKAVIIHQDLQFPLFMRTDFSSCKHGWKKTCYVPSADKIERNIFELLTESMMQGWMSYQDTGLVFREFLNLQTGFTAFHGDFPVNKERRYLIRDGKVQCHHPYWYPNAIDGHTKQEDWKEIVDLLNFETTSEIELLKGYAEIVGKVMDGYWSVDFAKGAEAESPWYLIDMAQGEHSFHWLECEHCPEQMRDQYKRK